MKILLPLAGPTPYFPPEDFPFPKPLIEIAGRPMIQHVIDNLRGVAQDPRFLFVALQADAARFSYKAIFDLATDGASETVVLRNRTAGALCSCLMAVDQIEDEEELLIANADQVVNADLGAIICGFRELDADAGVVTFNSTHPRWSYVRTNGIMVEEASEKRVISRNAIAGLYYFRSGRTFIEAAKQSLLAEENYEGAYFIAPCLNQLILAGKRVLSSAISAADYHSFYLPAGIEVYERMIEKTQMRSRPGLPEVSVVIPAAGKGSRFEKAGYRAPKPFIDVGGRSMIERVIENVSLSNSKVTVLLQARHTQDFPNARRLLADQGSVVEQVEAITEGTACTVLLARRRFDNDQPLLVANSDQLVEFSCEAFVRDALNRRLDGSILVFRDPTLNPKWSFAKVDANGLVTEVAEKTPISDLATVGIYLFTKGSDFVGAAVDMIARNDRVNNEFYTCPVYNYMIAQGMNIGVYEVKQNDMYGLGIPEDLNAYLTARGFPPSAHAPVPSE